MIRIFLLNSNRHQRYSKFDYNAMFARHPVLVCSGTVKRVDDFDTLQNCNKVQNNS